MSPNGDPVSALRGPRPPRMRHGLRFLLVGSFGRSGRCPDADVESLPRTAGRVRASVAGIRCPTSLVSVWPRPCRNRSGPRRPTEPGPRPPASRGRQGGSPSSPPECRLVRRLRGLNEPGARRPAPRQPIDLVRGQRLCCVKSTSWIVNCTHARSRSRCPGSAPRKWMTVRPELMGRLAHIPRLVPRGP